MRRNIRESAGGDKPVFAPRAASAAHWCRASCQPNAARRYRLIEPQAKEKADGENGGFFGRKPAHSCSWDFVATTLHDCRERRERKISASLRIEDH